MILECLENNHIPYIIERKNLKRLVIKYNSYGILLIKQPFNYSDMLMEQFVNDHLKWIIDHKPTVNLPHTSYHDGDEYLFLGKKYIIEIVYSNHQTVIISENKLFIYTRYTDNIEKLLNKFRLEQAEVIFNEMLYKCFKMMDKDLDKYPALGIKSYKSRWGCCYFNENKIYLNIALIHCDIDLIEYVVCHELAHFKYHDHSSSFHEMLKYYIPDVSNRRKRLKAYNPLYK